MAAQPASSLGREAFVDRRDPPAYRALDAAQREAFELGHALFNTQWVAAPAPKAARRDGLGPLFNGGSCDGCHNEGARARGLAGDEAAPVGFVVQLATAASGHVRDAPAGGDPVYGHTLNTLAIEGLRPEATLRIRYVERAGRYPDGREYRLRLPHYDIGDLRYGELAKHTLIQPRLAPALFGAGLLESVPADAIVKLAEAGAGRVTWRGAGERRAIGRFGWQADAVSIADQTARAFSREMGLSSTPIPLDDCTAAQRDCLQQVHGGEPEVSDDFMKALLVFQRALAVPASPPMEPTREAEGAALFAASGCATCHRAELPVVLDGREDRIAPYTDLLLHDLGDGLADREVGGRIATSLWRTAPLWGLQHVPGSKRSFALLHDGRARSVEEAVLWHDGEAAAARRRFERLDVQARTKLLDWVGSR